MALPGQQHWCVQHTKPHEEPDCGAYACANQIPDHDADGAAAEAREEAIDRMKNEAFQLGADAIVGFRFATKLRRLRRKLPTTAAASLGASSSGPSGSRRSRRRQRRCSMQTTPSQSSMCRAGSTQAQEKEKQLC